MSVSDHERPPDGYASDEPPADVVQKAKDAFANRPATPDEVAAAALARLIHEAATYKVTAEIAIEALNEAKRQRDQARDLAVDRDNRLAAITERLTQAALELEWQDDPQQAAVLAQPLLQESLMIAEGRS